VAEFVRKRPGTPKDGLSETSSSIGPGSDRNEATLRGTTCAELMDAGALGGLLASRACSSASSPPSSSIGEDVRATPEMLSVTSLPPAPGPLSPYRGSTISSIAASCLLSRAVRWFVTGSTWSPGGLVRENRRAWRRTGFIRKSETRELIW